MTVLKVSGLTKNFGGLAAVSNVNLEIEERELIGLIGPNGAGKTTLFNLLTGVYDPSEGKIELNVEGTMKSIGGLKPYVITGLGLARTFQNIRLFKNMTVLDNVKLAMNKSVKYSTLAAILRLPSYYREEQAAAARRSHSLHRAAVLSHPVLWNAGNPVQRRCSRMWRVTCCHSPTRSAPD